MTENEAKTEDAKKDAQPVENNTHEEKEELANNNAEASSKVSRGRKGERRGVNFMNFRKKRPRKTEQRKIVWTLRALETIKRRRVRIRRKTTRPDPRRRRRTSQLSKTKLKFVSVSNCAVGY